MSISDRVAIMRAGRIEQVGTPEEVYARPVTTYVARFIGSPQMDIFEGVLERSEAGVAYRVGEVAFPVPPSIGDRLPATPVDLGIRPEHVTIVDGGAEGVPVSIRVVQPIGPVTYVTLGWDGGVITSRVPGMARLEPGAAAHVRLDGEHLLFFDRESGRLLDLGGRDG